ncbi:MAG: D-alanine--D-alanine ligase, partial [Deltaproteobacteria bacterium]|nr:D-alanine--D-alanine ligase [Deltaproteobacteria bacterium]
MKLGLLFGGRSVEHDVSVTSATSILAALDRERFEIILIGVDTQGRWHLGNEGDSPAQALQGPEVIFPPTHGSRELLDKTAGTARASLDVIFPIIHGAGGEDGRLQGLLDLTGIPYVGSGVLGSSIQMDKDITKQLLRAAGIPVVPWHCVHSWELPVRGAEIAQAALDELGLPLFIKPSNLGSSVGISLVESEADLLPALREAARFDEKILIEQGVDAREVEIAVLGGYEPEASVPGEIRPKTRFYDYESKYQDDSTELLIPAPVSEKVAEQAQSQAVTAFCLLEAWGLARVDFFLERETGKLLLNEINSLPGFTQVSMYPQLWEASGLPYPALLNRLVDLALERAKIRDRLQV